MYKKITLVLFLTLAFSVILYSAFVPEKKFLTQKIEKVYLEEIPLYGVRGLKDGASSARYLFDGELISNPNYVFENYFRAMEREESLEDFIFFGGSYIFGYGLDIEQTLPYLFKEKYPEKVDVRNWGIPSWGIHQLLYLLDSGEVDDYLSSKQNTTIIYGHIGEHQLRSNHHISLLLVNPIYFTTVAYRQENGKLINKGTFEEAYPTRSSIIKQMAGLSFFRTLAPIYMNTFFGYKKKERDQLFCAILGHVESKLREKNIKFYIFTYDYYSDIQQCNFTYAKFIPFDDKLKNYLLTNEARIHPTDSHPSHELNQKINNVLVEYFKQEKKSQE